MLPQCLEQPTMGKLQCKYPLPFSIVKFVPLFLSAKVQQLGEIESRTYLSSAKKLVLMPVNNLSWENCDANTFSLNLWNLFPHFVYNSSVTIWLSENEIRTYFSSGKLQFISKCASLDQNSLWGILWEKISHFSPDLPNSYGGRGSGGGGLAVKFKTVSIHDHNFSKHPLNEDFFMPKWHP